jgi:hypothetical protein
MLLPNMPNLLFASTCRVPCEYKNQNLALRVEESSQNPQYLAIKFLYQGGQTEIVSVDVAKVSQKLSYYLFSILLSECYIL